LLGHHFLVKELLIAGTVYLLILLILVVCVNLKDHLTSLI